MPSLTKTQAAKALEALMGPEENDDEETISSAKQNITNRNNVVRNWALGPEKTSVQPDANREYWAKMADLWDISEEEARNRFCANCEYYDNTPYMQQQMKAIPLDKFDMDGGGRGYCVKFDFICHNLRTCQAWEEKSFDPPDEDEED